MRPLFQDPLLHLLLCLCPLLKHAAAAPPLVPPTQTTLLQAPTPASAVLPPSEPHLQLPTPTAVPGPAPGSNLSPNPPLHLPIEGNIPNTDANNAPLAPQLDLRAVTTLPGPAAPPAPVITPPPDEGLDTSAGEFWHTGVDGRGSTFRYRQTTYYTCVTQGLGEHCGWHRPILEVSGAVRPGLGGSGEGGAGGVGGWAAGIGGRAVVVGFVAGGFALLMG